jgi:hypothetical protein
MITDNLALPSIPVVRRARDFTHLMDSLRESAAHEVTSAFDGISGKRIDLVRVPGCVGRDGVSRAANGSVTNPLYRIAGVFVLMKRLGMGRERAQRLIDWLQEVIDWIWPEEDLPPLEEVLDREQDLDGEDDPHQQRIGRIPDAAERMLDAKRRQHAHDRVVIQTLQRHVALEAGL